MEFKVFKNENSKILKEYWLTQSEWDALDKTTVQEGDIYHIVGTIDKGDLSADVNASLAKADSSLQKPTVTLAKESFVKVGIDGTQRFDESSYVVAPSVDGTAGQVLKKTEAGTEWANESGGGGGGKYYIHRVKITANLSYFEKAENKSVTESTDIYINIISSNNVPVTNINGLISLAKHSDIDNYPAYINNTKMGGILNAEFSSSGTLNLKGTIIIYSSQGNYGLVNSVVPPVESSSTITDTVVEL